MKDPGRYRPGLKCAPTGPIPTIPRRCDRSPERRASEHGTDPEIEVDRVRVPADQETLDVLCAGGTVSGAVGGVEGWGESGDPSSSRRHWWQTPELAM